MRNLKLQLWCVGLTALISAAVMAPNASALETTIGTKPAASIIERNVSFTFTSDTSGALFECKLDSGAWAACTSPRNLTDLTYGSHAFQVRAIKGVVFDDTPASHTFVVKVNPLRPIAGVYCPARTTQINDTAARMDSICRLLYTTWQELGGDPSKPPEVTEVDSGPIEIPIDPEDPKKITDIIDTFEPAVDPTPGWGDKFEDCQTNPSLADICKTDPKNPPTDPDPLGPDITIDDPGSDSPTTGYHCDPKIWLRSDLVNQVLATPLDANGSELDPIDVYVLNPDFPAVLLPQGNPTADPPVPSLLSTRTGIARVGSQELPYWLDDPRGDTNVAYVDPTQQGCISIPDTAPTQAAVDLLQPSSALPDPALAGAITVSWSPLEQTVANNGGSDITGYEVQTLAAGNIISDKPCLVDPADPTSTKLLPDSSSCTVTGLTNGTPYTFKVRAINAVGKSAWSVATDPPLAPVLPARRSTATAAKAKKATPPGPPKPVTVTEDPSTKYPSGAVLVAWKAPKSNGGKPITKYLLTVNQVGAGTKPRVINCGVATSCQVFGLNDRPDQPLVVSVQAVNAVGKSAIGKPARPFSFVVSCGNFPAQPLKCFYSIKVKTIMRMSGFRTEPAELAGRKWQIACGHTPTVAYTKIRIKNPRFPKDPTESPTLFLGESFNAICRLAVQGVTVPLTKFQKGLIKKGYTAVSFKVMGLPSKGTGERPIPLPYALARVTAKLATPVNSRFKADGSPSEIAGNQRLLTARWVQADRNGVVTWIGVIKKKGYYETTASWPFYKVGKSNLTYAKSKAKK